MAKILDLQLLPRIQLPGAYAMIGETRVNHFHATAEVDVYFFADEDARHQRLSESEHELHRPVKIITVRTTYDTFEQYLQDAAKQLAAAGYKMVSEVPAGYSAEPRGLKELLTGAQDT